MEHGKGSAITIKHLSDLYWCPVLFSGGSWWYPGCIFSCWGPQHSHIPQNFAPLPVAWGHDSEEQSSCIPESHQRSERRIKGRAFYRSCFRIQCHQRHSWAGTDRAWPCVWGGNSQIYSQAGSSSRFVSSLFLWKAELSFLFMDCSWEVANLSFQQILLLQLVLCGLNGRKSIPWFHWDTALPGAAHPELTSTQFFWHHAPIISQFLPVSSFLVRNPISNPIYSASVITAELGRQEQKEPEKLL